MATTCSRRTSTPLNASSRTFGAIREWLREHLHRHGRKYMPAETLERAVGGTVDPEPYLRYLQGKLAIA